MLPEEAPVSFDAAVLSAVLAAVLAAVLSAALDDAVSAVLPVAADPPHAASDKIIAAERPIAQNLFSFMLTSSLNN